MKRILIHHRINIYKTSHAKVVRKKEKKKKLKKINVYKKMKIIQSIRLEMKALVHR